MNQFDSPGFHLCIGQTIHRAECAKNNTGDMFGPEVGCTCDPIVTRLTEDEIAAAVERAQSTPD